MTEKSKERFKTRIRELTKRTCGRSIEDVVTDVRKYLLGWLGYFRIGETEPVFDNLEKWIRRRLRCLLVKQRQPGGHQKWWTLAKGANADYPVAYFDKLGLPRMLKGDPNNTNRRMRTRKSGGVGGD